MTTRPAAFRDVLFLPGDTQADGLVRIEYTADNGSRDALTLYFLDAMRLLRQLEEERQRAHFDFPADLKKRH
jgi:hypothetical protein